MYMIIRDLINDHKRYMYVTHPCIHVHVVWSSHCQILLYLRAHVPTSSYFGGGQLGQQFGMIAAIVQDLSLPPNRNNQPNRRSVESLTSKVCWHSCWRDWLFIDNWCKYMWHVTMYTHAYIIQKGIQVTLFSLYIYMHHADLRNDIF